MLTVVPIWEKPIEMNRWCKWVLSGWKGEVPRRMRMLMTRMVSNTGMDMTDRVKGTRPRPHES